MKNTLTFLASVLAISTASAQAIAIDARTEQYLAKAHHSANAATRTYGKQPNGTTHALADVAFCHFSDQRDLARSRAFAVATIDKQLEALQRHRATVKLPTVECARPSAPLKI